MMILVKSGVIDFINIRDLLCMLVGGIAGMDINLVAASTRVVLE